jgi:hypothetical protein
MRPAGTTEAGSVALPQGPSSAARGLTRLAVREKDLDLICTHPADARYANYMI